MADLVDALKQLSAETGAGLNPVIIATGIVESVNPLKIMTDQKTPLYESMLRLTEAVTDRDVEMTIPGIGRVTVSVVNSLMVGESVLLLRDQGGQKYTVIDRVVS